MSTYTKTKTETPQPSEDRGLQRQNLISVFLIFLLLTLIVCSVLIFNKFSFTSKNIGSVEKNYEMQFIDLNDSSSIQQTQEQSVALTTQQTQTQITQTTTSKPPVETVPKQQTTQSTTQAQVTQPTQSEKNVGLDGYMLTSANIQKYHSALLKEFEGHSINDYRIVWGDTLWKIAMKFNTTAHTLYVLNAMDNPDLIITGNVLKVSPNFVILRERTEKILLEAMGKTGLNISSSSVGWFSASGIVQDICLSEKEIFRNEWFC